MSIDEQRLALDREIQSCEVKLALLPPFGREHRDHAFRAELLRKRDEAAEALAALERLRADKPPR